MLLVKVFIYNSFMESQLFIEKQQQVIFIKKYREKESDEKINNQRKSQILNFFDIYIHEKLTQEHVDASARKQIKQWILDQCRKTIFTSNKIKGENIKKYGDLVEQWSQQLQKLQYKYKVIRMERFLIKSALRMKISQLQILHIEYYAVDPLYLHFYLIPAYFVSAESFFRLVHQNARLKEVTIKGVFISSFQSFITNLAARQSNRRFYCWIDQFKPSTFCKFAIDYNISIDIQKKLKALSFIEDLEFFVGLFYELSQITITVQIGRQYEIIKWGGTLWRIWEGIRRIKKLELVIRTSNVFNGLGISNQTVSSLRTSLFAGLTTLTEINTLQFNFIQFSQTVQATHMLAMEQLLRITFENNAIKHLKFKACNNFPILPQNASLQSISFSSMPISGLSKDRALFLSYFQEDLLHEAQKIDIQFLVNMNLVNISLSPSNIKCLTVQPSKISLQTLFPKLFSLKRLNLKKCHLSHSVICSIASPDLEEMSLQQNHSITNEGLKDIDTKWPGLKYLTIQNCRKITAQIWNWCSFRGLVTLRTDDRILPNKINVRQLKSKGILVKVQKL